LKEKEMRTWLRGAALITSMALAWGALSAFSPPAKTVKLALQEGGTASWEIAAMEALSLTEINKVKLKIRPVADSKAGQVALQAGEVSSFPTAARWGPCMCPPTAPRKAWPI